MRDDFKHWNLNSRVASAGKPFVLPQTQSETLHVFFDDCIEANDPKIVDVRYDDGKSAPLHLLWDKSVPLAWCKRHNLICPVGIFLVWIHSKRLLIQIISFELSQNANQLFCLIRITPFFCCASRALDLSFNLVMRLDMFAICFASV